MLVREPPYGIGAAAYQLPVSTQVRGTGGSQSGDSDADWVRFLDQAAEQGYALTAGEMAFSPDDDTATRVAGSRLRVTASRVHSLAPLAGDAEESFWTGGAADNSEPFGAIEGGMTGSEPEHGRFVRGRGPVCGRCGGTE